MDEIHAVIELFISCRGSGWPLVRIEAEKQLLMQHLLMAAPMDKEEIEDLIKKCFEADNNGEINFLSFWAGMEHLLELLGIRDSAGGQVDEKVYGLQVFRDGLLEEAMSKNQGPSSSVLLSRDEVLSIIEHTNKSVALHHTQLIASYGPKDSRNSRSVNAPCASSLFWDEVYKETALLDPSSVLSVTELSMMVFGFLKAYIHEVSTDPPLSEQALHEAHKPAAQAEEAPAPVTRLTASGASSLASESDYAAEKAPTASSSERVVDRCAEASKQQPQACLAAGESCPTKTGVHRQGNNSNTLSSPGEGQLSKEADELAGPLATPQRIAGDSREAFSQRAPAISEEEHQQDAVEALSDADTLSKPSQMDIAAFLKSIHTDSEDPISQLQHLLLIAGQLVEGGTLSRKDVQRLRYANAAAVDCLDRLCVDRDKRNDEIHEAALALRRTRTEKQQLVKRLSDLEQQHSQLQLQQDYQLHERGQIEQLRSELSSERAEKERLLRLLRDKEEDVQRIMREKDAISAKISAQDAEYTCHLEAVNKQQEALAEEYRENVESLTREKAELEDKLRLAEDAAAAADAARQKFQGDAHTSAAALRQRIKELEDDKQRQETEAEENDALILQLQGRLEEKVQQVTILEVRTKQQQRLLQQVRGVRNSLMHVLQETKESEAEGSSPVDRVGLPQPSAEAAKLKTGLKAALAHIKELEAFNDELRMEQRRGLHPRYELAAALGESSAPYAQRRQLVQQSHAPLRALPTLGAELELLGLTTAASAGVPPLEDALTSGTEKAPNPTGEDRASEKPEAIHALDKLDEALAEPRQAEHTADSHGEFLTVERSQTGSERSLSKPLTGERPPRDQETPQSELTTHAVARDLSAGPRWSDEGVRAVSGHVPSCTSLRSEPSTTDAVSKEPTSSASLPEAEDIFDPLDLLQSEDAGAGEVAHVRRDAVANSSGASSATRGRLTKLRRSSGVSAGRPRNADATQPPAGVEASPPMTPIGKASSLTGLDVALGGRRCLSRATSGSSACEPKPSSGTPLVACTSPRLETTARSALIRDASPGRPPLDDSLGSARSDGSFLGLHPAGDAPVHHSGRSGHGRVRSARAGHKGSEVLNRRGAVDSTALSSVFNMFGACGALPGNAMERKAHSKDAADAGTGRKALLAEEKRKHPMRALAAVAASMSSKDAGSFRYLQRSSQSTGAAGPATSASETTPREGLLRARRTVSMGRVEIPSREAPHPDETSASCSSERGGAALLSRVQLARATDASSAEGFQGKLGGSAVTCGSGASLRLASEVESSGGAASPRRRKPEDSKPTALGTAEACRRGDEASVKRSPRSRSSSAESPFRMGSSSSRALGGCQPLTPNPCEQSKEGARTQNVSHGCCDGQGSSSKTAQCGGRSSSTPRSPLIAQLSITDADAGKAEASAEEGPENALAKRGTTADSRSQEESGDDPGTPSSQRLSESERAVSMPHLQVGCNGLHQERQDEQTASAAALLAAAAGVVDASLQQQQLMIQRQQAHHEDLQRAQQQRIDMLQEQLERLQRTKEEQRESGAQQQKKMIETLQAKLEELQRRQEQREHDFHESQRKLLQQELEIQLKQRFEELKSSPRRLSLESAGVSSSSLVAFPAHSPLEGSATALRNALDGSLDCTQVAFESGRSRSTFAEEPLQQAGSLQDSESSRLFGCSLACSRLPALPGGGAGEGRVLDSQLAAGGKTDKARGALEADAWMHKHVEARGGAGLPEEHTSGQQELRCSHTRNCPGKGLRAPGDEECVTLDASRCGSHCFNLSFPSCSGEEVSTTTSSTIISQSPTPAGCAVRPAQRTWHWGSDGGFPPIDQQMFVLRGDRWGAAAQKTAASSTETAPRQYSASRLPHLPSARHVGAHQHLAMPSGHADPVLSASTNQRINSSAGSLWSPKASKEQVPGSRDLHACCGAAPSAARPHAAAEGLLSGCVGVKGLSRSSVFSELPRVEDAPALSLPSPSKGHRQFQETWGEMSWGPSPSACHPVSRAEKVTALRQTPIDSDRGLGGGSHTSEQGPTRSPLTPLPEGVMPSRDAQLRAPLPSARSLASTTSHATTATQRWPWERGNTLTLEQTKRRDKGGAVPPSADFLGVTSTSARGTTTHRHTVSLNALATGARRYYGVQGRDTETPDDASFPDRRRSEVGVRNTHSSATIAGYDCALYGPRRTVTPLMNKLSFPNAPDVESVRQRKSLAACSTGLNGAARGSRESLCGKALDCSESETPYYRRSTTSGTLPDVDVLHSASHHPRQKTRHAPAKKGKCDRKTQRENGKTPEKTTADERSSSASQLSLDWSSFNNSLMTQPQFLLELTSCGGAATVTAQCTNVVT
ncbi:uncharacterized protein LOC34620802 [Cyclospora cayetanensis]|uniref:Uncharacterized protein LOC34620802 n=1 Tax=Cyclospora cayetanensis TaxID=88456 RepID=A0A6P6S454_9EIME|nr:uncharacterized protein LOC34620802 [Cyclospora cayetanensis]